MIQLKNIYKKFSDIIVLNGLSIDFKEGEITAILGPSGCGKTTLLNIAAGLIPPDNGEISGIGSKSLSFLFQEHRLLPWRTAFQNLEFILPDTYDKKEKTQACMDMLESVGLYGYQNYYPSQLSGGMCQRLAMARAFIKPSDILFMDEPFQSLDLKRRDQMIRLLKSLWLKRKPAVLMVTHDVQEALLLSDKIYILSDKPAQIVQEIKNPMPFQCRSVKNEEFYRLEQQIINEYLLK